MSQRNDFKEANKILASAMTDEYKNYFDNYTNVIRIKNSILRPFKSEGDFEDEFFKCYLYYIAYILPDAKIRLFTFFVDNNGCDCKYIDYPVKDVTVKDVQHCMDNFIKLLPVLREAYAAYKKLKVIKQLEDI